VVEALMSDLFVPNAISMHSDAQRCMVLTGPNMGGKTSYIKQVTVHDTHTHTHTYTAHDTTRNTTRMPQLDVSSFRWR
jgi:ABC-type Mn2+/Zn2+ transport system ATPase subunit